ncbi:MAG: sugar transferase [Rhodospirillales bacterium]|nr:sugar transferase [Rhodospirillales bacterium]
MKAKRAFDIVGSLVGIVVAAIPVTAAAVSLAVVNRGSPFFVQERVGLNRKPFKILKLKSLKDVYNAKGELLPVEQRVSKVGTWLRRTKIDEIPQFINVLKGDMSLVGPRPSIDPHQPFGDQLSLDEKRHKVLPGMTGLAQIHGLNLLSNEEVLRLDYQYVDSHSVMGDVMICLKTPFCIVAQRKAPHYSNKSSCFDSGASYPSQKFMP